MMKHLRYMAVAVFATVGTACSEAPTDVNEEFEGELVITEGIAAPEFVAPLRPVFSDAATAANVGGSTSTPLSLKPVACDPGQQIVVTYTITGRQQNEASFKVNTVWTYSGSAWTPSNPVTITVPARAAGDAATIRTATITAIDTSSVAAGTSSFSVVPFDVVSPPPATLGFPGGGAATINIEFVDCPVTNTPPALDLPDDFTIEATSSSGAFANFVVTATDAQDGNLSSSVVCTPTSGSTFALGTTTVNCSVTDAGGITVSGSFQLTVDDRTPPTFTSFPTTPVPLIAANIAGAELDIASLGITVQDVNQVSEPSTFSCDYVAGTLLAIGSSTAVTCRAKDADGNETPIAIAPSFVVTVGLNVNGAGFLPPLRMTGPFSVHKRGSTIPHKFLPPTYADGTPAIDLAEGLKLALQRIDPSVDAGIEGTEYATGSTVWRYDAESGHYIYNLKTGTSTPWDAGTWTTTVSFAGITLASTRFELKK